MDIKSDHSQENLCFTQKLKPKGLAISKFHCAHSLNKTQCSVSHLDWECCWQMMQAGVGTQPSDHIPKTCFWKCAFLKKHTKLFSSSFHEKEQVGLNNLAFCWFCPLPNLEGLVWDPSKIPSQLSLRWILQSSPRAAFRVTCNCNENSYSHLLEILV